MRWALPVAVLSALSRPLVLSSDEDLLDELLRLLAAAGAEPELAVGGPGMRRAYREAPLVLLGSDALASEALRSLPRRPGVVVVATAELPSADWARAVEVGAERVAVLPDDEAWLLSRAAAAVRSPVERGRLLAVGGSCGGAGVSTLATALAMVAGDGALLVDADPWGGGLDLLLGGERAEGLRWPELTGLRGRVAGDALLASLPLVENVHVLAASRSGPQTVPPEALTAVVEAARSSGRTVVVDLPRAAPDGKEWSTATVAADADLAVLVVPALLRSATAARLLVDAAGSPWCAAQVVVRRVPGGLDADDVTEIVGRPVVAELAHDRGVTVRGERGKPPVVGARSPFGGAARRVLACLQPSATGAR